MDNDAKTPQTLEDRFIYTSINANGDKHIEWKNISESIKEVWRKIYRTKVIAKASEL